MIDTVTIDLTTHCNRRCPDCCAGIGINRVLQHHDWPYFERAARMLYGIERVNLTGGEPTAHPQFAEFVPRFRELFGCNKLTMSTNGYRVVEHISLILSAFDAIDFSDYDDNPLPLRMLRYSGIPLRVYQAGLQGINFTPRATRGTGSCFRACAESGTVAYADGKLYGCCVAPGVAGAVGIKPRLCEDCNGYGTKGGEVGNPKCDTCRGSGKVDWRAIIEQAPLPCADCWFATGE
jgi:Radical SAM superfamily/4Fe-4S single cluster domain